jgi:hypothetical protein
MAQTKETLNLTLEIKAEESDAEELDRWARQLRREIEEAEVGAAELLHDGSLPERAKSPDVITLGSVVVAVLPALLPKLIDLIQAWVSRRPDRPVTIKSDAFEVEIHGRGMSQQEISSLLRDLEHSGEKSSSQNPA